MPVRCKEFRHSAVSVLRQPFDLLTNTVCQGFLGFRISITQKNERAGICICLNYMKILLQVDIATVLLPRFRGAQLLPLFFKNLFVDRGSI